MLVLLQRVSHAKVTVSQQSIAEIAQGLVLFCGFQDQDDQQTIDKMLYRCFNYRVFSDAQGKMNLSALDVEGTLLFVPQFTLAANTQSGLRPSFSSAAGPTEAKRWFDYLQQAATTQYTNVTFGQFGADMQVTLCNDGPVTFLLEA